MSPGARTWGKVLRPFAALVLGLAAGLLITWVAGESPMHVLLVLAKGAFGTRYDFGMTLFYATPLVFTGLSVAVAFHAGLFNIGAEGQLTIGALAGAATGALLPGIPFPFAPLVGGVAAVIGGLLWGALPGWLRARRGSHEVINTIMLNFIASGVASYVTLHWLKHPGTQNPETRPVGPGYLLAHFGWFDGAPVSAALLLAVVAAFGVWALLWRTPAGYRLRAVGQNETAARMAGIDSAGLRIMAMALAGGLAGLVAMGEVFGNTGNFRLGFSPDYGFIGIAVALLGRNHPAGILAAAWLFGALHKGTADLDLETERVTRDLSLVLQAVIILAVAAEGLWDWTRRRPVLRPAGGGA